MKKFILLAPATLLTAATLLLAGIWLRRVSLEYNEQGRHFDVAHSVVYDEGAIAAYGLMTALFALTAISFALSARRRWLR